MCVCVSDVFVRYVGIMCVYIVEYVYTCVCCVYVCNINHANIVLVHIGIRSKVLELFLRWLSPCFWKQDFFLARNLLTRLGCPVSESITVMCDEFYLSSEEQS